MQSYFGANVLHPRTIIPVMQYDIPIVIRNIFNLSAPGTKICRTHVIESEESLKLEAYVKGFAAIDNLALVNVEGLVLLPLCYIFGPSYRLHPFLLCFLCVNCIYVLHF